ncbi:hypothetical protein [uncultured Shewanella sp.]|uniref:hypothetical protein n=1 Tax=uncultured Shewanella sp. TaxID=173975 RepID=UPI002607D210|nr:hypothetical protein [uncultured Shewanella sp.]
MEQKAKKHGIFAKIQSREDALKTIKDCSKGFFFIAIMLACVGYFMAPSLFIDAALYAVFAGILFMWKSRIAAVCLLIIACFSTYMTIMNLLGLEAEGGSNIALAILILWSAIRAVEATFKVHGQYVQVDV